MTQYQTPKKVVSIKLGGSNVTATYSTLNEDDGNLSFIIAELSDKDKQIEYKNVSYYRIKNDNIGFDVVIKDFKPNGKKGCYYIHESNNWESQLEPNERIDKKINPKSLLNTINFRGYRLVYFVTGNYNPFYDGYPHTPKSPSFP